jgi:putative transposase
MIERCRDAFPIRMMCQKLSVSPSGFYEWRDRPPSQRSLANDRLVKRIRELHEASKPRPPSVENHLKRDFDASRANSKWATDITYVRTAENWLYLCVVIDLHSRLVVGWSMSAVQDRQPVLQAVLMALWQREERAPLVLHSDRGCQFTSGEYQRFLSGHNLTCSMSGVGSCADNALVEGFFGMLKRERVNRRFYQNRADARADIFDYIEGFYNLQMKSRLEKKRNENVRLNQTVRETGA